MAPSDRILLLAAHSPWPPITGACQRTNLIHRALSQAAAVDLALLDRRFVPTRDLERLCGEFGLLTDVPRAAPAKRGPLRVVRRLWPWLADGLARRARGWRNSYMPDPDLSAWLAQRVASVQYGLVVSRHLRTAAMFGALDYAPVIVDCDDLDTQARASRLRSPDASRLERWTIRRGQPEFERTIAERLRRAARVWVATEQDRAASGHDTVAVLPNIPYADQGREIEPLAPPRDDCDVILLVASFRFDVNCRAVERFVRAVWPRIRQAFPTAALRLVGTRMTDRQRAEWSAVAGVEAVGFVEDIRRAYESCAFTVVPVFEGGGTKIKVLESLACGRACVAARHSQRGYEAYLRHGESLWVAGDEKELVDGCVALLKDRALRDALAARGSSITRENFSFEAFRAVVQREAAEAIRSAEVVRKRKTA